MTRPAIAALLAILLSGCAAASGNTLGKFNLNHDTIALPTLASPAPIVLAPPCPADLLADVLSEPPVPPAAGFPAPETAAASAAVQAYLAWLHAEHEWGKQGWARALTAKMFCEPKP